MISSINIINIINIINYHYLLLNLVSTGILSVFFFEAHRGGFGGREVVRRERGAGAWKRSKFVKRATWVIFK